MAGRAAISGEGCPGHLAQFGTALPSLSGMPGTRPGMTKDVDGIIGRNGMVAQRRGAAVEIVALQKEFVSGQARIAAIENIDLAVAPGEFVCIVGPSGCGKSTVL
ncbi:MAG: ATP-binding cassette domain-containing protein, partial [Xanthobacteraceae bacterium]